LLRIRGKEGREGGESVGRAWRNMKRVEDADGDADFTSVL
jgi:hypothetical protein